MHIGATNQLRGSATCSHSALIFTLHIDCEWLRCFSGAEPTASLNRIPHIRPSEFVFLRRCRVFTLPTSPNRRRCEPFCPPHPLLPGSFQPDLLGVRPENMLLASLHVASASQNSICTCLSWLTGLFLACRPRWHNRIYSSRPPSPVFHNAAGLLACRGLSTRIPIPHTHIHNINPCSCRAFNATDGKQCPTPATYNTITAKSTHTSHR